MAKTLYSIRDNGKGSYSIGLPSVVAVSLGITDMKGNLLCGCVSVDLSADRSHAIIKPADL